jgi:hypothetical protein
MRPSQSMPTPINAIRGSGVTRPIKRTREEKMRQRLASSPEPDGTENGDKGKGKLKEKGANSIPSSSRLTESIQGPRTEEQAKTIETLNKAKKMGMNFDRAFITLTRPF